ncbi:MAG: ThuA domain-containing protein, partial [Myxococcales bacterium]|nr:ThuA domain-containing protein [Myxococcales bacterium]
MKTAKRIAVILGAIALVLGVVSLVVIRSIGAWNLVFPNRTHETVAPELPEDLASPAVLVFTKTNGFR